MHHARRLASFAFTLTLALALGCGARQDSPAPPAAAASHEDMCPMHVTGTHAAEADTEGGAAMVFTSTGDVATLRLRVHHMAEMHDQMHHGNMVPSHAVAEDVDGGARIVLTPEDSSQVEAVRAQVREHAQMMQGGECPMMKMHAM
jgi:hypothetical protein